MSNFGKLINRIQGEIQNRAYENSMVNHIQRSNKSHANCRAAMAKAINASHSLSKSLTPTKGQVRKANQDKMRSFRKSLSTAVKNRTINGLQACQLEARANATSSALAAKGLI